MAQRAKGQDTKCILSGPNGVEQGVIDVQSFEMEIDIETLEEAFLGETSNRFDDIFNGVSFNAESQLESRAYLDFIGNVQDRAQRRLPADTKFIITFAIAMPNGTRQRLVFEDVFFGPIRQTASSRKDFVKLRFEGKCSTLRRIG